MFWTTYPENDTSEMLEKCLDLHLHWSTPPPLHHDLHHDGEDRLLLGLSDLRAENPTVSYVAMPIDVCFIL